MEIQITQDASVFEAVANEHLAGREGAVACINARPCVWTGRPQTLDEGACKRHGLYIGRGQYCGGSIVNMPGDLSVCITTRQKSELARQIVDAAAEWLARQNISVTRDNNDVLADGKKVLSWAMAKKAGLWQSVVHFSVGKMDLQLVREICTKPIAKLPGALSDYGITADDCLKLVKSITEGEN